MGAHRQGAEIGERRDVVWRTSSPPATDSTVRTWVSMACAVPAVSSVTSATTRGTSQRSAARTSSQGSATRRAGTIKKPSGLCWGIAVCPEMTAAAVKTTCPTNERSNAQRQIAALHLPGLNSILS